MQAGIHARDYLIRDSYRSTEDATMRAFLKKISLAKASRAFAPFLTAFGVGVLLRLLYPPTGFCREQVWALGDALLVAGIIGLCIEAWFASVLIDHVADQLSSALVGYGLPKAAQDVIRGLVDTKNVYRDYRVAYRIDKHSTLQSHVAVCCTSSYTVVNNGTATEPYRTGMALEGLYRPQATHLQYGNRVYVGDEIKRTVDQASGVVTFSPPDECKSFNLKPSGPNEAIENLNIDQQCVVRWQVYFETPEDYSDVVAFPKVAVNPMIEFSGSAEQFEFCATTGPDCIHESSSQTWRYRKAFIDGQHVRVWWKPKTA